MPPTGTLSDETRGKLQRMGEVDRSPAPDPPAPDREDADPASSRVDVPIGEQSVRVPSTVRTYLQALPDPSRALLDATRVWVGRKRGRLVVHVGDVDGAAFED